MIENGFNRSCYDSCVYYKQIEGNSIYLLLYVYDMFIACKDANQIEKIKSILKSEFEM